MRHTRAWMLAVGLAGLIAGYPWALSWAFIPDPTPDDVRRLAAPLVSQAALRIYALDSRGQPLELAPTSIADFSPGPCLRESETEGFGRRGFEVRVTHWCRIDLTLADTGTATAGLVRHQWLGAPPEGLHEDALPAEPHELPLLLQRLGG